MREKLKSEKALFVIFLFGIIVLISLHIVKKFRMSDFNVYYTAGSRIVKGENLYQVSDGFYHHKYSPFSALFFSPLSIFNIYTAKIIWFLILLWTINGIFILCERFLSFRFPDLQHLNKTALLAFLVLLTHFYRELYLGQVNAFIFFLLLVMFNFFLKGRDMLAGLFLALPIFFKPTGLFILPYFLMKKRYKLLLWIMVFCVILFILPMVFYGFNGNIKQHKSWFSEISIQLAGERPDMPHNLISSYGNHNIYNVLAVLTKTDMLLGGLTLKVYAAFLLLIFAAVFFNVIKKNKIKPPEVLEMAILLSAIPLFASSSSNCFVFTALGVYFVLAYWETVKNISNFLKIFIFISFLLIGGNIYELWGRKMYETFNNWSLISIGTAMLIGFLGFSEYE